MRPHYGVLGAAAAVSNAANHELIVANFLNGFLYTVDFDDEALTLDLVANITVPVPSSWISFSVCHTTAVASSLYSLL